jgi:hypothetical protein
VGEPSVDSAKVLIEQARLAIETERLKMEQVRLGIENDRKYFEQWKTDLSPLEQNALEASKAAITFAQNTLRSLFLLNGGALIALPTFSSMLRFSPAQTYYLLLPIGSFVVGLVMCTVASFLAYFALGQSAARLYARMEVFKVNLNEGRVAEDIKTTLRESKKFHVSAEQKAHRSLNRYEVTAVLFGVASLLSFIFGATTGGYALAKAETVSAASSVSVPH